MTATLVSGSCTQSLFAVTQKGPTQASALHSGKGSASVLGCKVIVRT